MVEDYIDPEEEARRIYEGSLDLFGNPREAEKLCYSQLTNYPSETADKIRLYLDEFWWPIELKVIP